MDKIFIGSSKESVETARIISGSLKKRLGTGYMCIVWEDVIRPQEYTIPALIEKFRECRFAVFVFSKDDITRSRGKQKNVTRDNVIYECGLATGMLGEKNCFIVKSPMVTVPSDFKGLNTAEYDEEELKEDRKSALSQAATEIASCIMEAPPQDISWNEYMEAIKTLCSKIRKSPKQNGFRFDAVVGISRGGIIAADLLNRECLAENPLVCMWADYKSAQPDIVFDSPDASVNTFAVESLGDNRYKNILVVDDITRTGKTVIAASDIIRRRYPDKRVECAVLFLPKELQRDLTDKVRYFGKTVDNRMISMPYAVLD